MKVLEAVRKRLSDKSQWTEGAPARDKRGNKVAFDSPYACCWDLRSALRLERQKLSRDERFEDNSTHLLERLICKTEREHDYCAEDWVFHPLLVTFNDTQGHMCVMDLLKRAIKKEKKLAAKKEKQG